MQKSCIKEIGKFKICYRENSADEDALKFSFANDVFFRGLPEYYPKDDHTIIDIGAHIGIFSLLAASKVPNGRVFAIEACEDSFRYLKKNIELNNFKNIIAERLAIYDDTGTMRLYHDLKSGNWGNTVVKELSVSFEECPSDSLERFMKRHNIELCNFLKLNCEGAEFKIILSTPSDILKKIKFIFICCHYDLVNNFSERDLDRYLTKNGFYVRNGKWSEQRGWIVAIKASFLLRIVYTIKDGLNYMIQRAYYGLKLLLPLTLKKILKSLRESIKDNQLLC